MDKYTCKNLIIDPETQGLEDIIGKEVYYHNTPLLCLDYANEDCCIGTLKEICKDDFCPFRIETPGGDILSYACIIPKKEESKPEYIPFKNQEEFLSYYAWYKDSLAKGSSVHRLSRLEGVWLKRKYSNTLYMVTEIWDRGVTIGNINLRTTGNEDNEDYFTTNDVTKWCELYENYTFPDDTPCGSLKGTAICNIGDSKAKTVATFASNVSI